MKVRQLICNLLILSIAGSCSSSHEMNIILQKDSDEMQWLAAKEVRKYIYLRTGTLPEIVENDEIKERGDAIEIRLDPALSEQEFKLNTINEENGKKLVISGGSGQSVLYGAYELAEQLGVRFYLHGDVIPDKKIPFVLPELNIQKKPLFSLRGILPFHDFPEGPDWWNVEEYNALIAQLPKLKMNFIGFHCYPYRPDFDGQNYKAEPLVWIGKEENINPDGTVRSAYPVLHFNTLDSTWGYLPAKTSDFLSGASQLFENDYFGAEYMMGITPWPHTDEENIDIVNETGKMISSAFELARRLGVKTCAGTESPLIIPGPLKEKFGIINEDESIVKELYKGIFSRIEKTFHLDYYWLWTPEYWTWKEVRNEDVIRTEKDMMIAFDVLSEMGKPFTLATCGWVLGPPNDRTEFDHLLPKEMPFSCINRGLGYTPVDIGFSAINDRPEWSIPWMEDDPSLLTTQLWAGRMRKDALDSWKYGCDGLFGIHWRTRIIGPNISSLAKAAWECDTYDDTSEERDLPVRDFYTDFVQTEFGTDDPTLIDIFVSLDGKGSQLNEGQKGDAPLVATDWISGPGALMINRDPEDIQERIMRYDFLEEMELAGNKIKGKGNSERFNYWLNVLRFNKAVLESTLSQIELNSLVEKIKRENDPLVQYKEALDEALPKRLELKNRWEKMNRILLEFVSNTGEMGTIANIEMHSVRKLNCLTGHDDFLKSVLKSELPDSINITESYSGDLRIVATTHQSIIRNGEDFHLRLRVLSKSDNLSGKIYYRCLGDKSYTKMDLKPVADHVFEVLISSESIQDDFEYFIEVYSEDENACYPVTAGNINNIVVIY